MLVANSELKSLLDAANHSADLGNYEECFATLQTALDFSTRRNSLGDKAIVEDHLAVAYFTQGKLNDAKSQWLSSLSDGIAVSNLVLQADVLVALSALSQQEGDLNQSLRLANQALDLARKSKNLYIQSRALGELGHLQLLMGRPVDARASLDEALQMDRLNGYNWEAGHLLYLAWVNASESKLDKAVDLAVTARDLAVKHSNYITFMQASFFLGNAYVHSNRAEEGIQLLDHDRKGISNEGKPLFESPEGYTKTVALPYFNVAFSEALGLAYEGANRPDEALKTWQELYDTASSSFGLAKAESARHIADLYKGRKEFTKSIDYYARAAEASTDNEQNRIQALTSEVALLSQLGDKERALKVEEEILPLAKASKNLGLQFFADMVIAELLDGTERFDRVETTLKDADSLVSSTAKIGGVENNNLVELYLRLADLYEKRHETQAEMIAIEKALTPALAWATAPDDKKKNGEPLAQIMKRLESKMPEAHIQEAGEAAYSAGRFADALISFEILQYFQEVEAGWKGKYEDYRTGLNTDPIFAKLLQLPPKIMLHDDGAVILATNIEEMGSVVNRVEPLSSGLLTNYYMSHQQPDLAAQFARRGLSSFSRIMGSDAINEWSVAMSCELATSLLMQKDLKSAVEIVSQCLSGAKKLGLPQLLQIAHQTNVWVLDAAGRHDDAQESIQFLLKQASDDPSIYVQLATMKGQQGDWPAAADAWGKALALYEAHKNPQGAADANLAIASSPTLASDSDEKRVHLEAADKLYVQLGSPEGRVKAEAGLGTYYAARKNAAQSQKRFQEALSIAHNAGRKELEALVLSQIGQASELADNLPQAAENYDKSADLYQQQNDLINEALQLKNEANVLNSLHRPDEALKIVMKAKADADKSNNWPARYWVRRTLAIIYGNRGEYQNGVIALNEAKQISDDANQPLPSAWAALDIAAGLETIGSWQEASEQINSAIPVLEQFKDVDDEATAYIELMAIYGARESELKDLGRAVEFYQRAYQLLGNTHPERAASLNLDLTEIYWNQGRFKDAILKAEEALHYYTKNKDEIDEAGALISLAEAQRSDGDLQSAAKSLQSAEPLVSHVKNFYTLGRFYYGRAGLYRAQGKLDDAIRQYEEVIKMLEQFKSGSDINNRRNVAEHYDFIYDELIDAYYALAQSDKQRSLFAADKALEYSELNKARVFSNSWGHAFADSLRHQLPVPLQETEATLSNQHAALDSELQQAMSGEGRRSLKDVQQELAKLESRESEFEGEVQRSYPGYAEVRYPRRMSIQQVPLRPGELLVQVKVIDQATFVWLLTSSGKDTVLTAFYKVDRSRQWFSDRVLKIRDAFNGGHPEQFDSTVTDELFVTLFPDSVIEHVKDAKSIIFVPDDVFFLLPFEILTSRGQYLFVSTPTEYFPSSAALRLARTSIHVSNDWQESFIGIADPITSDKDPRYQAISLVSDVDKAPAKSQVGTISLEKVVSRGFSLDRLPATAIEVQGIAGLFASSSSKAETRTGVDATKQALLRTDLARYRFIHFATHGILPVEAGIREPALVLSYDGKGKDDMLLTLSEILGFKLRAEMVVLSACNTGSGKVMRAEGVASLGSAFLAAGASSVTVSLWHVDDNRTARLMQEYYKNLVQGKTKSAALAAARTTLFSLEDVNGNPYYWAPFILTGD
jgi:CHAT domain-containing protein